MEENKTTVTGTEDKTATGTEQTENKTYTSSEVESMIDSRISKAYEKWQKKASAQVTEAEKLARMSESEKASYEISQREKALADKEKALAVQENKIQAAKVMSDKGISLAFLDFIVSDDADAMMENIKLFQKELAKNIEAEVRKRMASGTPKVGGASAEVTVETFKKMGIAQRTELFNRDKDLYEKLSKQ
jgi:hypothetical protein